MKLLYLLFILLFSLYPLKLNLYTQPTKKISKNVKAKKVQFAYNKKPKFHLINKKIFQLIKRNTFLSTEEKVKKISAYFLGRKYKRYCLGEGKKGRFDQNPLYRFDQFDCTTYIETVIALAASNSYHDFIKNIKQIRYKNSQITFFNRKHFSGLEWLPDNSKKGYIKNKTSTIHQKLPITSAKLEVNKKYWFKIQAIKRLKISNSLMFSNRVRELKNYAAKVKKEEMEIDFIDLNKVFEDEKLENILINNLPESSIINIIKDNYYGSGGDAVKIIHQGFFIKKKGKGYFRHASSRPWQKIVDTPIRSYLKKLYYTYARGITIYKVQPRNSVNSIRY